MLSWQYFDPQTREEDPYETKMGMGSWHSLRTTTSLAAELLGIDGYTGKMQIGYEADLIAIPDNPITDAKALQDVIMVMSNGNMSLLRLPFGIK